MAGEPLTATFFERLYERTDDPWSFATSPYENAKYDATLAHLGTHYAHAFEIGCSIGVLTERLAARCDDLLAVDVSDRALAQARVRCAEIARVRFDRLDVPAEFPDERFDLIVLSEVGYYWSDERFALARERIAAALIPGGDLLLVHYLPRADGHMRDGDAVHEAFVQDARFSRVRGERTERYRLDLLRRR